MKQEYGSILLIKNNGFKITWIEQVKSIEDKLSEEIHQSLMQKFVDKNKSEVVQSLNISEKNIS